MRSLLLIDTSAWRRIATDDGVHAAYQGLLERYDGLAYCAPQLLEWGYSARSRADWARLMDVVRRSGNDLPTTPEVGLTALELQNRLWSANAGRAVGVIDLLIASHALVHSTGSVSVTVIHYDADYERIFGIDPTFRQRWIAPRGAVA